MTEPKRGCLTCKWADYLKTPTGRLSRWESIHCRFPMNNLGKQIAALRAELPDSMKHNEIRLTNHGMSKDDGANCVQWEPTP